MWNTKTFPVIEVHNKKQIIWRSVANALTIEKGIKTLGFLKTY